MRRHEIFVGGELKMADVLSYDEAQERIKGDEGWTATRDAYIMVRFGKEIVLSDGSAIYVNECFSGLDE